MDKEYFLQLLNKYLRQEASGEECELLLRHYNLFDLEPEILNTLTKDQKSELKNEIDNNIRNIISSETSRVKGKRSFRRKIWISVISVAAVMFIVLAGDLYFIDHKHLNENSVISRFSSVRENRLIQLPDGSTVIVSHGSKLNYPSSFDGLSNREVYLDGQAYFDVKHNSLKPFIIHTGKLKTTVLGTAFEINAWSDEPDVRVTVSRGKVKVEDQNNRTISVITPNQQITYDKTNENIIQKVVNVSEYLEWKDHDLLLSNVTISEAAELLEKRFQVKILISDEQIKSKRFTTTVLKGERIEQILNSIAEFNDAKFTYDVEKSEVLISSK
ncbi:ferric-dicitrate binding protein FerR, regulates iron transport through sigma-19 [Daejeonella rubra]|uniref:Ferric-dicitrate binding protein FerR, regulates iron transport through sigma-19 n=1 Tax=Daejeonella rubra TaxID=990371 RepID=A0A1G9Y1V3_9SPHI|nr:FecR domain-containing protein [Daejeonella rubra]SDN02435.1 ferric-dicitrate binding protein FerR, regulates iron transport through sigma-19 [Daejeonella rubra]